MNITLVCDVLGQANNGTTIAALNLMEAMRRRGHRVRVVCPDEARRGQKDFYIVPVYNLGPFNGYVAKNGVSLGKPDKAVLKAALDGADVVHVMMPFGLGRAALKIARAQGIPVTAGFHCQAENVTSHLLMMDCRLANYLTYQFFYRTFYRYCDSVHYPTAFICDLFERQTHPTHHYVISNGVASAFSPGPPTSPGDRFTILFTGRYSREKAHSVLIDAAAKSRYRDRIDLVFAGDGPQKRALLRRAKRRGIKPPVMRFYTRDELIRVIRQADLYVHPAKIEIEAIACLEAIACGKVPVISDSPRSATRYFALTPQNRFRCGDAADLARKIDYWIEHPEEKAACARQYADYSAQFEFESCMDKMQAMLAETARGRAHG